MSERILPQGYYTVKDAPDGGYIVWLREGPYKNVQFHLYDDIGIYTDELTNAPQLVYNCNVLSKTKEDILKSPVFTRIVGAVALELISELTLPEDTIYELQ